MHLLPNDAPLGRVRGVRPPDEHYREQADGYRKLHSRRGGSARNASSHQAAN
jgi:hypothetical protein